MAAAAAAAVFAGASLVVLLLLGSGGGGGGGGGSGGGLGEEEEAALGLLGDTCIGSNMGVTGEGSPVRLSRPVRLSLPGPWPSGELCP